MRLAALPVGRLKLPTPRMEPEPGLDADLDRSGDAAGRGKSLRGSRLCTGFLIHDAGLWYCPGAGVVAARLRARKTSVKRGEVGTEWPRASMLSALPKLLRYRQV